MLFRSPPKRQSSPSIRATPEDRLPTNFGVVSWSLLPLCATRLLRWCTSIARRRKAQLLHGLLYREAARPLARRKLLEALQMLRHDRLRRDHYEDVVNEPAHVVAGESRIERERSVHRAPRKKAFGGHVFGLVARARARQSERMRLIGRSCSHLCSL